MKMTFTSRKNVSMKAAAMMITKSAFFSLKTPLPMRITTSQITAATPACIPFMTAPTTAFSRKAL